MLDLYFHSLICLNGLSAETTLPYLLGPHKQSPSLVMYTDACVVITSQRADGCSDIYLVSEDRFRTVSCRARWLQRGNASVREASGSSLARYTDSLWPFLLVFLNLTNEIPAQCSKPSLIRSNWVGEVIRIKRQSGLVKSKVDVKDKNTT
jgi:hypothetical protein